MWVNSERVSKSVDNCLIVIKRICLVHFEDYTQIPIYSTWVISVDDPENQISFSLLAQKDVGVIVLKNLKPTKKCPKSCLGLMARGFHYRSKETRIGLYKWYVCPHLEYDVQAWWPWTISDIASQAVRMCSALQAITYQDKLTEIGWKTLDTRRNRANMIKYGKCWIEKLNWKKTL